MCAVSSMSCAFPPVEAFVTHSCLWICYWHVVHLLEKMLCHVDEDVFLITVLGFIPGWVMLVNKTVTTIIWLRSDHKAQ